MFSTHKQIKQTLFLILITALIYTTDNIKTKITILFFATILNFILRILNFGIMSIAAMAIGSIFDVFTIDHALQSFCNPLIWQILIFLFLAQALIKSGLSRRIALNILYWFGDSSLKLSYGICLFVSLFAIILPTSTARIGGLIIPIINDILDIIDQENDKLRLHIIFSVLYANTIASAMFLSASAGNFYIQNILEQMNLQISGNQWLLNSLIPGLLCLTILPFLLQYITTKKNIIIPNLKKAIKNEINKIGTITPSEIIISATFAAMFLTWIYAKKANFLPVLLILLTALLIFDLLNWKEDIIQNEDVWNTFFWLSNILMLSQLINHYSAFEFITTFIHNNLSLLPYNMIFSVLLLFYGYSQYFFASSTVHTSAFFEIILRLMLDYKFQENLSILTLCYSSNLFAGLTSYSSSEIILLSKKYRLNAKKFIKTGFIITSILYSLFMGAGLIWWKITGVYI